ncbi:hypothetical protein DFP72DRAFT_785929, partial [Ephemerocybe angulata]
MGFWFPAYNAGFYAPVPSNIPPGMIFYAEALCVVSAIDFICDRTQKRKILIRTDNQNTVDIFASLRCLPEYNPFLTHAIDRLL